MKELTLEEYKAIVASIDEAMFNLLQQRLENELPDANDYQGTMLYVMQRLVSKLIFLTTPQEEWDETISNFSHIVKQLVHDVREVAVYHTSEDIH